MKRLNFLETLALARDYANMSISFSGTEASLDGGCVMMSDNSILQSHTVVDEGWTIRRDNLPEFPKLPIKSRILFYENDVLTRGYLNGGDDWYSMDKERTD